MNRFFFRKSAIKRHLTAVLTYVSKNFVPLDGSTTAQYSFSQSSSIKFQKKKEQVTNDGLQFSDRDEHTSESGNSSSTTVQYSLPSPTKSNDKYNADKIAKILSNRSNAKMGSRAIYEIGQNINQTFVEKLLYYINRKGAKDSTIYKAAQIDKRLFSKIVSNRYYQPSKDTAIALAFALELTFAEACDFICRAGYAFSHCNKRDVIIEYFFRQKIYNLIEINGVLYELDQKLIGRL